MVDAPWGETVACGLLPLGGDTLGRWVWSPQAQGVFALPGGSLYYVRGRMNPMQILPGRPSYINALLMQSRGFKQAVACTRCQDRKKRSVFPECRRVPGHFGSCCGNCKWPDKASYCRFPTVITLDSSSDSEPDPPPSPRSPRRLPPPPDNDDDDEDERPFKRQRCTQKRPNGCPRGGDQTPIVID